MDICMVLSNRVGREPRFQLGVVVALEKGRGHILEFDAVEGLILGYVTLKHILVL